MPAAVSITRMDYTASELRGLAARSRNASQSRRLLAIALIMEGESRGRAAAQCGMDRQTLRDWVHRYNAEGPEGLVDRPPCGASCRLSPGQLAVLSGWVESGPDAVVDGVVRWRCVDLMAKIEQVFGVCYSHRGMAALLNRLGFRHISARARSPGASPAAQAAFKKLRRLPRRQRAWARRGQGHRDLVSR